MEQIFHRGTAAGLAAAVAGAGLIAVTPIAPPPVPSPHIDVQLTTDVFIDLAQNIQNSFTDLSNALTGLLELHPSAVVEGLFGSLVSSVFIPQNLIIAGLAALTGNNGPNFFDAPSLPVGSDVFGTVGQDLQIVVQEISNGLHSLFSLDLTGAFTDFSGAFDYGVLGIPAELVVGPLLALGL